METLCINIKLLTLTTTKFFSVPFLFISVTFSQVSGGGGQPASGSAAQAAEQEDLEPDHPGPFAAEPPGQPPQRDVRCSRQR